MEQRWASTEIGSVAACGSINNERRSARLPSSGDQTAHLQIWRIQEKLCQDGSRTSRLCGTKPWTKPISENGRNRRPHGLRIFICSLSWYVAQILAGPPLTKGVKQAKEFAQFLRDLGRDYHWSILCLQEFTASNGEVVTETAEGHRVFATPHARSNDVWRLWAQLRLYHS